ncbi:MAG: hypothetical protein ACI835_002338 [Planctomycetota bacterium]|jgi:hypothetical protein
MEFLTELWLPILIAAVFVFIVSSITHMVIPLHAGDYQQLPNEEAMLDGMRSEAVPPGDYVFPFCNSIKDMETDETMAKFNRGPVGFMTVLPNGPMAIGKSLLHWFLYSLMLGIFVAYITRIAYAPGAETMAIFRMTGTIAVMGYATAHIPNSIWKGVSWATTGRFIFDGLLYGLATGAAFCWFWPELG